MVKDFDAMSHFVLAQNRLEYMGAMPDKTVTLADRSCGEIVVTGLLLLILFQLAVCEVNILPVLRHNMLLSVRVLVDNGYMTFFHSYNVGVIVHDQADVNIMSIAPRVER